MIRELPPRGVLADPRGLLQEASWLLDLGLLPDSSSASRGIGYQEVSTLHLQLEFSHEGASGHFPFGDCGFFFPGLS
jgi:hypothetical protein